MLEACDIALLMDREWTDGAGNRRTLDRSRHGIETLVGDGTTVGTFPTWDATRGLYTFDGSDYLHLVDDNPTMNEMGGIPGTHLDGETYIFYFSPFVLGAIVACWFCKNAQITQRIEINTRPGVGNNRLECEWADGIGSVETLLTPADSMLPYIGHDVIFTIIRRLNVQEVWADEDLIATGIDTSEDARSPTSDACIGHQLLAGWFMAAGTGLRFWGYAARSFTYQQIRQLRRGFRNLL